MLQNLFMHSFAPKPLNEKALASMKAKGLSPGKSPRDLLLVVVTGSDTHTHIGISMPHTMEIDHKVDDFVTCFMGKRKYNPIIINDSIGKMVFIDYECEFPFKERDFILQCVFNELKKRGIYVDDTEDDEIYEI